MGLVGWRWGRNSSSLFDDVPVQGELANQRIDLAQSQRRGRLALQITPDETIIVYLDVDRRRASIVHCGRAVFLRQRQHTLNAAHCGLPLLRIHRFAENPDAVTDVLRSPEQLLCRQRCLLLAILGKDAMGAAWLPCVFAQQLSCAGMQQPNVPPIPLYLDSPSNPARRSAVVSSLDFHAAVHMNGAFAVLVIAEWLDRKRQQSRLFFGEHRCDLTFRGAMNACVGPVLFPTIQVGLRFDQSLETLSFERCVLRMADAGLDLALRKGIQLRPVLTLHRDVSA